MEDGLMLKQTMDLVMYINIPRHLGNTDDDPLP